MSDAAAADEPVVENPGADPNAALNPHMGGAEPTPEPDGRDGEDDQEDSKAEGGDSPSPADGDSEKKPDDPDSVLRKKVGQQAYENRELKRRLAALEGGDGPKESEPVKTLKDFNYDEAAFEQYKEERTQQRIDAAISKRDAEVDRLAAAATFEARRDAFEAESPGFKERLHADDLLISPEMAAFIQDPDAEYAMHVGDYLASNKAEAARIFGLPPAAQAREMVKIEMKVADKAKALAEAKSEVSNAPPPATTVDGTDPGIPSVAPNSAASDELSDEEWLRRRNKQLEKSRNTG